MPKLGRPVPFTGVVVCYNEAHHLADCLATLSFCDQLIVVDLGSQDASVETAQRLGAEIVHHRLRPVVEEVHMAVLHHVRHEWVVLLDPDERLPDGIDRDLRAAIGNDPALGAIYLPFQFYFKDEPLRCTFWGQPQHKPIVRHRDRVDFLPDVHRGWAMRAGFTETRLPHKAADGVVRHYWMRSYRELIAKHRRYVKAEGAARYSSGERFDWALLRRSTLEALRTNLIDHDGLRGGWRGIFLSFFHAWYVCMSLLSLRRYQENVAGPPPPPQAGKGAGGEGRRIKGS